MICPSCGVQVPENEYLCPNCSSVVVTPKINTFYGYTPDTKKKKKASGIVLTTVVVAVLFLGLMSVGLFFFGQGFLPIGKENSSQDVGDGTQDDTEGPIVRVTFQEGLRLTQAAELLEKKGVCNAQAFIELSQTMDLSGFSFGDDVMANAAERYYRLEGYIFPDTYDFYRDDLPELVLGRFLRNYEKKITDEHRARAQTMNMTMDQVVALASIITKEAGKVEEMPMVSSVFHNRLNSDYKKLESDPTFYYPYAGRDAIPAEQKGTFKSRYNTYEIKGIPPGAICNPGLDAIEAALSPEESDYFFFVYDINGQYYFAATWEEHQENVRIIEEIKTAASRQDNS